MAPIAHGLARLTYDVDAVYARDPENIRNLSAALQDHKPYRAGRRLAFPFTGTSKRFKQD